MTMYLYQSTKVHFLFKEFDVTSGSGYFGALACSFILGFITEALSVAEDKLD